MVFGGQRLSDGIKDHMRLRLHVLQGNEADFALFRRIRMHVLIMALLIPLDELVGGQNDFLVAAEVRLHVDDTGIVVVGLETEQGLRVCAPGAVDTLVFVTDHKNVAVLPYQLLDNAMLYQRSILCLIQTDIAVLLLRPSQDVRVCIQQFVGHQELVVEVHEAVVGQMGLVLMVELVEVDSFLLNLLDLVVLHQFVLDLSDALSQGLDSRVAGVIPHHRPGNVPDNGLIVGHQLRNRNVLFPGAGLDDRQAEAVDSREVRHKAVDLSELLDKPLLHLPGRRLREGDGQDIARVDTHHMEQVAGACHDDRGLPAPRHSQQQSGSIHPLYSGGLLVI